MSNEVGYEIDFLPVGTGDHSGDAIAVRYGSPGHYQVLVVDGGTNTSGAALVEHIQTYYKTDRVDYVVNSHPDRDHASGLSVVLENLEVGELWMHQPWNYSHLICDYFKDGRITSTSLAARLQNKMADAYALENLAEKKGIPIHEPFAGERIGGWYVCSPEKEWYIHTLIKAFEKSPDEHQVTLSDTAFGKLVQKAIDWVGEKWDFETLREDVETSAENESSVILYGHFADDRGVLLTADAGINALTAAADWSDGAGVSFPAVLKHVQVPHHGSRNNVSPSTLDRILGPRSTEARETYPITACVSASFSSTVHPRKVVLNAFLRRGAQPSGGKEFTVRYHHNMPPREGWTAITPYGFSNQVESWD